MENKSKRQIFMEEYNAEIKEELKNNSIVLSFAITIVIIGFFSIFYDCGNGLLIGIAISTLLLTIIQCFSNGNTMLNILPIFTMLVFGFFQKSIENIPVLNLLLKENLRNFIIFIAFSLSFFTQAYKNILYSHSLKRKELIANKNKNKIMLAQLSTDKKMVHMANRIKRAVEEKGLFDSNITKSVDDLVEFIDSESFITTVKSSLILKGSEERKSTFNIEEVEESILMSNGVNSERDIIAQNNDIKSLDQTEPEEDPFDFDFKFD